MNRLLEATGWLTEPGANVEPGYTDATRIDIRLTRQGETIKVWCHGKSPGVYDTLVRFLMQIHRQEYLLKRMTAGGLDRVRAFHEVDVELRTAEGESLPMGPIMVLDYGRFIPMSVEVVNNMDDNHTEAIVTALKLLGKFDVESERDVIWKLTTVDQVSSDLEYSDDKTQKVRIAAVNALAQLGGQEAFWRFRSLARRHERWGVGVNDAIVEALVKLNGSKSMELLKDMIETTPSAGWALIRLGEPAIPTIVEVLEEMPEEPAASMGQIHLIRQYIDNWKDVPKPVDDRVINAVQDNLDYRLGFSRDWTQYHEEFLKLTDTPVRRPGSAYETAQAFLDAAKDYDRNGIDRMSVPAQSDWHERRNKLMNLSELPFLKVMKVYVDRSSNMALAAAVSDGSAEEYITYVSIYLNFNSGRVWRVANIVIQSAEEAEKTIERFLQKYPNAERTYPQSANAEAEQLQNSRRAALDGVGEISVVGRVLNRPDGRGVGGVKVVLWPSSGGDHRNTVSQKDGSYSFEGLDPNLHEYVLRVENKPGVWNDWETIRIEEDERIKNKDLYLKLDQSISGVVRDEKTSRPLADMPLFISVGGVGNRTEIRTDSQGRYLLYVRPRYMVIMCEGENGYCLLDENGQEAQTVEKRIAIGPGEHVEGVDFKGKWAPVFWGEVLYPDGSPVQDVEFRAYVMMDARIGYIPDGIFSESLSLAGRVFTVKTDREGKFAGGLRVNGRMPDVGRPPTLKETISEVSAAKGMDKMERLSELMDIEGGSLTELEGAVWIPQSGIGMGFRAKPDEGGQKFKPLKIVLGRCATARVFVVDPEGKPFERAWVDATGNSPDKGGDSRPHLSGEVEYVGDGLYVMRKLIPGVRYHLNVHTSSGLWQTEEFILEPGQVHDVNAVQVQWVGEYAQKLMDKALVHEGRESNKAYERQRAIFFLGQMGSEASFAVEPLSEQLERDSSSDVRYQIAEALGRIGDARALGSLRKARSDENERVRKAAADAIEQIENIKAPETEQTVDSDGLIVSGRVLTKPGGVGVGGVRVKLWSDWVREDRFAVTDEEGKYRFNDVVPGPYLCRVADPPDGVWIEGVAILATGDASRSGKTMLYRTSGDGRIAEVGPGGKGDGSYSFEALIVSAGQKQPVELYLELPQSISGTVRDEATGKPVAGAAINFMSLDVKRPRIHTDANGQYRLSIGPREVQVICEGTEERYYPGGKLDERNKTVRLKEGEHVKDLDFQVHSAPTFSGEVVLADGSRAPEGMDVNVVLAWRQKNRMSGGGIFYDGQTRLQLKTDRDGRFSEYLRSPHGEQVSDRQDVSITAYALTDDFSYGGMVWTGMIELTEPKIEPMRIAMTQTGSVELKVIDPNGQGVEGASITGTEVFWVIFGKPWRPIQRNARVTDLGQGRYRVDGLIADFGYIPHVEAVGYRHDYSWTAHGDPIVVQADQHVKSRDIKLEWNDVRAVPGLMALIRPDNGYAIGRLGKIGPDAAEAVPVLVEILKESTDKATISTTVATLGKIGVASEEVVGALIEVVETKRGYPVNLAVEILADMGAAEAIEPIENALQERRVANRFAEPALWRLRRAARARSNMESAAGQSRSAVTSGVSL